MLGDINPFTFDMLILSKHAKLKCHSPYIHVTSKLQEITPSIP